VSTGNRILFDTTVLVDLLCRRPKALAQLRLLAAQGATLFVSTVSVAEIYSGIRPGEEEGTARLLALFDVIPLSDELSRKTGELVAARRRVGRSYSLDDMAIAATAIACGCALYTANKRDFEVPGILFYTAQ
jgi:predicted nucleic acid-binding protein